MAAPKIFQQILKVTAAHIDGLHHVNNVQYLYWVQEIAKAHWREITNNTVMEGVWVVRKHNIFYKKPAYEGDILKISTFVRSLRGPLSERIVHIHNTENNTLLVQCTTQWCFMEAATRKVLPAPALLKEFVLPE